MRAGLSHRVRQVHNAVSRSVRSNAANPSPLAGKLFDDHGKPLTPSHAVKAGRRYRYYVSQNLVRENGIRNSGWRIPSREIEGAVLAAVSSDRDVMLWHQQRGIAELVDSELLKAITRVQIHDGYLRIATSLKGAPQAMIIDAPFTLRRRGVEARIVLAGNVSRPPDTVLAKRILRAMSWLEQIRAGVSITKIAAAEAVSSAYITNNLDLAFLAPQILTAIIEGRQPPEMSAKRFTRMQLPIDWTAQEAALLHGHDTL